MNIHFAMSRINKTLAVLTPGVITGSIIAGYNVSNIKWSPEYNEDQMTSLDYTRFGLCIAAKGTIYGIFYPFAWFSIVFDAYHKNRAFESHFIPFSKHGIQNKKIKEHA